MATAPLPDPVEKWKREAVEAKRERRIEREVIRREWAENERERRAAMTPQPPDMTVVRAVVRAEIEYARGVTDEAVGSVIGQEIDAAVSSLKKEIAHRDKVLKAEREAHRRELDAIHKELNNVRQSHARDLATLSRDIAAVARTIDQLGRTINSKKMDELREDFANGFANLRGAIGDLKH